MTKRLVWRALGGAVSALVFWSLAHASPEPFADFGTILWVGDSLKDIVRDSEGGQMPSREKFDRRHPEAAEQSSRESDGPAQGLADNSPPQVPDIGGSGSAIPVLSAWVFGIFNPQGKLIGAGVNETVEECEAQLTEDRQTHPGYRFSRCIEIRSEKETL